MKTVFRLPEVLARTGLSKSTAYRLIKSERFPKQVQLSERCVGWLASEIEEWIEARIDQQVGGR